MNKKKTALNVPFAMFICDDLKAGSLKAFDFGGHCDGTRAGLP